jgi:class 3 adenylate cyclase
LQPLYWTDMSVATINTLPSSRIDRRTPGEAGCSNSMLGGLRAFLFTDLCGYTEYTWRHGDELSAELAVGFQELVSELAEQESCELVKATGDGAMVLADSCRDAVRLAYRIHTAAPRLGYLPVRTGIDTGPAVHRNGDWYGTTVNTAARVCGAAAPGELLMTQRARDALIGAPEIRTVPRGLRTLKGLPACQLHAALESAVARYPHARKLRTLDAPKPRRRS